MQIADVRHIVLSRANNPENSPNKWKVTNTDHALILTQRNLNADVSRIWQFGVMD